MTLQLPPTLVVQQDHGGDKVNTSTSPPAPFLEFSMGLILQIPITEIEHDEDIEFRIRMIRFPGQCISFHAEYIDYAPNWSEPALFCDFFHAEWEQFAGTWQIYVRGPLWIAPVYGPPLPTIDLADPPYVEVSTGNLEQYRFSSPWAPAEFQIELG